MSLYFVRHQHDAATCPAQDPAAGNMLLEHISPFNVRKYDVQIKSDAVLDGQHTFVLILEADGQKKSKSSSNHSGKPAQSRYSQPLYARRWSNERVVKEYNLCWNL